MISLLILSRIILIDRYDANVIYESVLSLVTVYTVVCVGIHSNHPYS